MSISKFRVSAPDLRESISMTAYTPQYPASQTVVPGSYTYQDAVDRLLDAFPGVKRDGQSYRQALTAVQSAYAELPQLHAWTYWARRCNVVMSPVYSTGTVSYAEATRILTLTGGTWPSWIANGSVRVQGTDIEIESRISDTTVLVNEATPLASASGVAYTAYRTQYPLPAGMVKVSEVLNTSQAYCLSEGIDRLARVRSLSIASPARFEILGGRDYVGQLIMEVDPIPDKQETLSVEYRSSGRPLQVELYSKGKATVVDNRVTLTGGVVSSSHVGCVIRLSSDGCVPTSEEGNLASTGDVPHPYAEFRMVKSRVDATVLEIDGPPIASGTYTNVGYTISSPVDIDLSRMKLLMQALAEVRLAELRASEDTPSRRSRMQRLLVLAIESDQVVSRSSQRSNFVPYTGYPLLVRST